MDASFIWKDFGFDEAEIRFCNFFLIIIFRIIIPLLYVLSTNVIPRVNSEKINHYVGAGGKCLNWYLEIIERQNDALKYSVEIEYRRREIMQYMGMTGGIGFAYTIMLINTTEATPALINADTYVIM